MRAKTYDRGFINASKNNGNTAADYVFIVC